MTTLNYLARVTSLLTLLFLIACSDEQETTQQSKPEPDKVNELPHQESEQIDPKDLELNKYYVFDRPLRLRRESGNDVLSPPNDPLFLHANAIFHVNQKKNWGGANVLMIECRAKSTTANTVDDGSLVRGILLSDLETGIVREATNEEFDKFSQ